MIHVKTLIAPSTGPALRIVDYLSFMIAAFVAGLFAPRPDPIVTASPQFFAAVGGCALSTRM